MASCLSSFCVSIKPSIRHKYNTRQGVQVRAQNFGDEGRSRNIVDSNLNVLREKIEVVKMKERLERCCKCENGWNYVAGYDYKLKREKDMWKFFELVGLISGTIGFTCLSGTVCLFLVSFFLRLIQ